MTPPCRTLILGLDGAGHVAARRWLIQGALPFLADLAGRAEPRRLEGELTADRRDAWDALLAGPRGLWAELTGRGLGYGALGMPAALPRPDAAFMVIDAGPGQPPLTHPPGLAAELADYQGEPSFWRESGLRLRRPPDLDQLSAELSAIARLRLEHALRLAQARDPSVLAVNFAGLRHALAALWPSPGRLELLLGQYDAHLRRLVETWRPAAVAVLSPWAAGRTAVPGPGRGEILMPEATEHGDRAGFLLICAPARGPEGSDSLTTAPAARVLAALAAGEGGRHAA